jgi:hypothetical protein
MRAHPFDGPVKHVSGQGGHHHVAQNDFEVARENLMHAFDAILDGDDLKSMIPEEIAHDIAKLHIIFEEKDLPLHVLASGQSETFREIHNGRVFGVALHDDGTGGD